MSIYVQSSTVTLPYPGLRPFRSDESEIFFGREEHVAKLTEMLERHHFVAVVGPSGCGKSSLVTAGLLPLLVEGHAIDSEDRWHEATVRPGDHPITRLAEALVENDLLSGTNDAKADRVSRIGFLDATLRRGPLSLLHMLEDGAFHDGNLLVVVDQFEEIFRFRHEKSDQEADAFVAMLLETARQAEARKLPIYIMLTMRSDYLGDCGQFSGLPEAISESQFLTPRLSRDERHAAIVGPAAMFGGQLEPALVNRLLNDMGDDPDQLPIMQHALMRMWSLVTEFDGRLAASDQTGEPPRNQAPGEVKQVVLTTEVYDEVGGWEDTLSNHADEAWKDLGGDGRRQHVAEMLFRCLTQLRSGGSPVRRPVSVGGVAAVAGVSTAVVQEVVDVFRHTEHHPDRSFVTPPAETKTTLHDDEMLDISHESLIRQWKRLKDEWAVREADSAEKYQSLLNTARSWKRVFKEDEDALWRTPNLDFTLNWWNEQKPSPDWAKRYGGDFELAKDFLDKSEAKQKRDKQQREAARQRELDEANQRADEREREATRFRRISWVMTGCVALAFALGIVSLRMKCTADEALLADSESKVSEGIRIAGFKCQEGDIGEGNVGFAKCEDDAKRLPEDHPLLASSRTLKASWEGSLKQLPSQQDEIVRACLASDGSRLATCNASGKVRIRDIQGTAGAERTLDVATAVSAMMFSPYGRLLATVGEDGSVRLWSAETGKSVDLPLDLEGSVRTLAFSAKGNRLAIGCDDDKVYVWDVKKEQRVGAALAHENRVQLIAFNPVDDNVLATGTLGNTVCLWNVADGKKKASLAHENTISTVQFGPDGKKVLTTDYKSAYLWDVQTSEQIGEPLMHNDDITTAGFSPDGEMLFTASRDKTVYFWNVSDANPSGLPLTHDAGVNAAAFSHDGSQMLTFTYDTVRLWDTSTQMPLGPLLRHKQPIKIAAFHRHQGSKEYDAIVTVDEHEIHHWRPFRNSPHKVLNLRSGEGNSAPAAIGWSESAFMVSDGETVRSWDASTEGSFWRSWETPRELPSANLDEQGEWNVYPLALSQDGCTLVAARQNLETYKTQVFVSTFKGGRKIREITRRDMTMDAIVGAIAVNGNGKRVFIAIDPPVDTAQLWDVETEKEIDLPKQLRRSGPFHAATFHPNSESVVTAGPDRIVRVWTLSREQSDERSARSGPVKLRHCSPVKAVAYSPDGRMLATGSDDGTTRLWDVESWQPFGQPFLAADSVVAVTFNSDSSRVAVATRAGTIHFWSVSR